MKKIKGNYLFLVVIAFLSTKYFLSRAVVLGVGSIPGGFAELFMIGIFAAIVAALPKRFRPITYCLLSILYGTALAFMGIYYNYFSRFPTIFNLSELGEAANVKGVGGLFSIRYLLYYIDIPLLFIAFIGSKWIRKQFHGKSSVKKPGIALLVLITLVTGITFVTSKDIAFASDREKVDKFGFAGYQTMTIVDAVKSDLSSKFVKLPSKTPGDSAVEEQNPYFGIAKGKNVIIIQLEAFQNFIINQKVNGVEITPNLNKLLGETVYFDRAISQISQGNTSDAEFISNTSIYPMPNASVFKTAVEKDYYGLPEILKGNGYYTATFHANTATFWNRKNMYPSLGFDHFYDVKEIGKDDTIGIGASDEVTYTKVLEEMKKFKAAGKPFYTQIISLSGHFPYKIPAKYQTLDIPAAYAGCESANYLLAANYTDRALGEFLEKLKAEGLYDDSLIVMYGDHFGVSTSKVNDTDKALLKSILGREYDKVDMMNIPLIMKLPGTQPAQKISKVAGQMDVMPTILALLGIEDDKVVAFGKNLFSSTDNIIGIRYYMPTGSYADDNVLCSADGMVLNWDHSPSTATLDTAKRAKILELMNTSDAYLKNLSPKK